MREDGIAQERSECVTVISGIKERLLLDSVCHLCGKGDDSISSESCGIFGVDDSASSLNIAEVDSVLVWFVFLDCNTTSDPVDQVRAGDVVPLCATA